MLKIRIFRSVFLHSISTLNETPAVAELNHILGSWKATSDKNEASARWNEAVSAMTWNETGAIVSSP